MIWTARTSKTKMYTTFYTSLFKFIDFFHFQGGLNAVSRMCICPTRTYTLHWEGIRLRNGSMKCLKCSMSDVYYLMPCYLSVYLVHVTLTFRTIAYTLTYHTEHVSGVYQPPLSSSSLSTLPPYNYVLFVLFIILFSHFIWSFPVTSRLFIALADDIMLDFLLLMASPT